MTRRIAENKPLTAAWRRMGLWPHLLASRALLVALAWWGLAPAACAAQPNEVLKRYNHTVELDNYYKSLKRFEGTIETDPDQPLRLKHVRDGKYTLTGRESAICEAGVPGGPPNHFINCRRNAKPAMRRLQFRVVVLSSVPAPLRVDRIVAQLPSAKAPTLDALEWQLQPLGADGAGKVHLTARWLLDDIGASGGEGVRLLVLAMHDGAEPVSGAPAPAADVVAKKPPIPAVEAPASVVTVPPSARAGGDGKQPPRPAPVTSATPPPPPAPQPSVISVQIVDENARAVDGNSVLPMLGDAFVLRRAERPDELATLPFELVRANELQLKLPAATTGSSSGNSGTSIELAKPIVQLGAKLTTLAVRTPGRAAYNLVLPSAVVPVPVDVRFRPRKRLYGKVLATSDYPGRDCAMAAQWPGRAAVAMAYVRKDDAVVLGAAGELRATPAEIAAVHQARLVNISVQCQGVEASALTATNFVQEEGARRLVGELIVPETRPFLLGLIAARVGSVPDPAREEAYRETIRQIAHEMVSALDETYRRNAGRWATGDILAVTGGIADETVNPARLVIGGGIARGERASELAFDESGPGTIDRAMNEFTRTRPDDFVAVANAYAALHAPPNAQAERRGVRLQIVGLVVDGADDATCNRWRDRLALVPPAPASLLIIDNRDREAADDIAPCGSPKGPVQVLRISLTTYSSYSRSARTAKLRGHIARLVDYGATRN